MGSMNKMFTATAILQLVQAGKVKLDAPLGTYLTNYPNRDVATKVTIHHLLTHTGGTGDIFGPEFSAHRLELKTLDDYVKLYGARGLEFEPGSKWEYSNYGFLLLGVIVERVSGQSYYDYVRDHIFMPAGMTGSGSEPEELAVPGRAKGYMQQKGVWMPNTDTLPYRGTSAGGGYTTVGDLLRFASALTGHTLLDAKHTALLTTGKVDTGQGDRYAYGFVESVECRREELRPQRGRAGHERRPADLPRFRLRGGRAGQHRLRRVAGRVVGERSAAGAAAVTAAPDVR